MSRFPDAVIRAMHHAATTVTCIPVAIDQSEMSGSDASHQVSDGQQKENAWESAIFFVLPLSVTHAQITSLFPASQLFPVAMEADLIEHENGTLIELTIEIDLGLADKPAGRIVFLTGHIPVHHEAVTLLGKQESIGLFIGDVHCNLLHQQRIPLASGHRQVFNDMLKDALKRDALIKMSGKYDPDKVFGSVTSDH